MIGISGDKLFARKLQIEITHFLELILKQPNLSLKTTIINLRSGKLNFLGYEWYFPQNRKMGSSIYSIIDTTFRRNVRLQLDIPLKNILKIMEEKGFVSKLALGYRPISKAAPV